MASTECPECEQQIPEQAVECPHCAQVPDGPKTLELHGALALIILIMSTVMTISWHQDGGALWGLGIVIGGVYLVVVRILIWRHSR